MEFAVYRIFRRGGRKLGSFVTMRASREEAEQLANKLKGEHEVADLGDQIIGVRERAEQQTKEAKKANDSRLAKLSLEEVELELNALREFENHQPTQDESILAGIYIAELEAERERKLRARQMADADEGNPVEAEREE